MLVKVDNLSKSFSQGGWLFKSSQQVLKDVSFTIRQGECLGVVGESGSGKSTLGKVLLGMEKPDSGVIQFSSEIQSLPPVQAMSVVFQDYNTSVNPRMSIGESIAEPLLQLNLSKSERSQRVTELLAEVGLSDGFVTRYPHQLSGGQLQRVCIARAIAPNPKFILLDEAVSSLDVSVQVQILDLLLELKKSRGVSYLFITHDIAVASYLCDRIIFFKDGQIETTISDISQLGMTDNAYAHQLLSAASYLDLAHNNDSYTF